MLETSTTTTTDITLEEDTRSYFAKIFQWMGVALAISGVVAWYVSQTPQIIDVILSNKLYFWWIAIIKIWLIWYLNANIQQLSVNIASIIFAIFSALNGAILSIIFLVFQLNSIVSIFWATTALFLLMWRYGYITKRDLTTLWNLMFMVLGGIIIGWLINIFLQNTLADLIITSVGVIVFIWLIAYDIQKLKKLNTHGDQWTNNEQKEAIIGALELYLDFINLFLKLLRLFGKRK